MIWLLLLAADVAPASLDAVAAAPASHRIILENDDVRVLRVEVGPGATEPVHEHRWPSVMYFEQPQPITYIVYKMTDGKLAEAERFEAPAMADGTAVSSDPEGPHAIRNRGTAPFVAVRVEFKRGAPAAASARP